ncbi:hypothetical protein [Acinetobacter sp. WCHAc010052]|uniref:hypothetical protein n=1 Tax=Acinetobacter sp. WCHAc010052 TaxID=2004647 RepID=UPI000B3BFAF4|nr:hypothetical protein [Acinetobacter sp. WCHAc010052]AXY60226.1 hypothetical protein CDG61_09430 [Acinetobacter sp. WCHAc010052]
MEIQKDFLEMQIAYEKNCAIRCNCSYEELKAQLDNTESLFGTRYLEGSPRHENWLLWVQAWQAAQIRTVPDGYVLIHRELSDSICKQLTNKKFETIKPLWLRENFGSTEEELELAKVRWISLYINRLKYWHKEIIEVQEQIHG